MRDSVNVNGILLPEKRDSQNSGSKADWERNDIRDSDERSSGFGIIVKKGGNAGSGPLFPDTVLNAALTIAN